MIAMTNIYRPDEKCPVRSLEDGMVVMAPTGDQTHTFDEIGTFIWRQLDGERDLDQVVKNIRLQYDVSQDQAEADLQEFISTMVEAEIIVMAT